MTRTALAELINGVRRRCGAASDAEKRKALNEFIVVTGYHEIGDSSAERQICRQDAADPPTAAI